MSEAALSIKSVDKIYEGRGKGPVHAVKNLDMEVQRGEIVALLGSSGCGKTSIVRAVAERSADRWSSSLGDRTDKERLLWRLLRLGGAPYFVLGASRAIGPPMRLRIDTAWDWQQRYRLTAFEVPFLDDPPFGAAATVAEMHAPDGGTNERRQSGA